MKPSLKCLTLKKYFFEQIFFSKLAFSDYCQSSSTDSMKSTFYSPMAVLICSLE
jgi:hypothetical protein